MLVLAVAGFLAAGSGADVQPRPRVTMITDSVGGVLYWVTDAQAELAQGLDFQLETKTCRKLASIGCPAYGERPPSALETIESLGPSLGPLVIIDVGYNDIPGTYADGLDTVMQALVAAGVQHVVWVTLEETESPWVAINAQIRAAPGRWPQLVVADWAPVAAMHPEWFVDQAHMNAAGGLGFASFLRPIVLAACGAPCVFTPPPKASVTMLQPTVGARVVTLRWHGDDAARTYDLAVGRSGAAWSLVAANLAVTSYRLRGRPASSLRARVRARNASNEPGPWSQWQFIRFKTAPK
jgi:hypothetical protein